jgi:hypothetical protein
MWRHDIDDRGTVWCNNAEKCVNTWYSTLLLPTQLSWNFVRGVRFFTRYCLWYCWCVDIIGESVIISDLHFLAFVFDLLSPWLSYEHLSLSAWQWLAQSEGDVSHELGPLDCPILYCTVRKRRNNIECSHLSFTLWFWQHHLQSLYSSPGRVANHTVQMY